MPARVPGGRPHTVNSEDLPLHRPVALGSCLASWPLGESTRGGSLASGCGGHQHQVQPGYDSTTPAVREKCVGDWVDVGVGGDTGYCVCVKIRQTKA